MFITLIEEFIRRAQFLKLDDLEKNTLILGLKSKKILTNSSHWNYLSWDSKAECLLLNNECLLLNKHRYACFLISTASQS